MTAGLVQDTLVIALNLAAMLAMGLELTVGDLAKAARRRAAMAVGLAVNLVVAPVLAWGLIAGLDLPPAIALGFLLVACAPGGNTGPLFTANARGDIAYAVALVVVLSFASVASVPLLMSLLAGRAAADFSGQAPAMIGLILAFQIAPLCVGMAGRRLWPGPAARAAPLARVFGNVCLLGLTVVLIALHGDVLLREGFVPLVTIELFVLAMLASGLLLGSPRDPAARALGLTSCTRNLACSMLLGSQVFPEQPAVLMGVLAYGLLWLPTVMPVSFALRRFA